MPVLQRGCVKSVQRGYRDVYNREIGEGKQVTINISPINPNKSLLLIDIQEASDNTLKYIFFNLLQSSIAISTTYQISNIGDFTLSYQVVEFY